MYVLRIPNFNLRQVYESCQDLNIRHVFGFEREGYMFFKGEDMCKVEQIRDRFFFSCDEDKFYDVWFDFFDLSTDYAELNSMARRSRSGVSDAARSGSGVHVLRQDAWECILKEMMFLKASPDVARARISSIIEASTEERGKTLKGYGYVRWRPLPTWGQLDEAGELLEWFCDTETIKRCNLLVEWSKSHRLLLASPGDHSEVEAGRELMGLFNDSHVVNRILAYGFGFQQVDVTGKKQASMIERQTGVDVPTLVEFELSEWVHKTAYVGTLLARQQALKNRMC